MTVPQKKMREAVLYALFTEHFDQSSDKQGLVELLMEQLEMSKRNIKEAMLRALLITEKLVDIDAKIKPYIQGYDFDRISFLEKAILRLATYEMFFDNSIPEVVAISEGIRLCRKFSTLEGAKFVNGVLDGMYKQNLPVDQETSCLEAKI